MSIGQSQSQALLTLGSNPGASDKQLKKAYRKKAFQYHPDKGGTQEEFIVIKECYDFLKIHGTKLIEEKPILMGIDDVDPMAGYHLVKVSYRRVG